MDGAPRLPFEWDLESVVPALPLLCSVGRQAAQLVVVGLVAQLQPRPERPRQVQ